MKIIADNTIPFLKGIIEQAGEVTYLSSAGFTAGAVRDADLLIVRSVDRCSREILKGSRVKLIVTATIGYDHIDTAYCEEAGITWRNAPGSNAESVAEYVLASLIRLSMRTKEPLAGKTVGIVGAGHVGTKVEYLCKSYGMRILRNDPPRAEQEGAEGFVSLQEIAERADIITLHTPLTEGKYPTYHLVDKAQVNAFARKPWLINTGRGAVTDTAALLEGMTNGKIGAMVMDCWENEPHISLPLLAQTVIATPHIAGFSADGKANATRMCLEEISHFFRLEIKDMEKITPSAPAHPVIDLDLYTSNRIEQAILSSFDPIPADRALREEPRRFESFRAHYNHPREFSAYSIANATSTEASLLQSLGFRMRFTP
ncbi:MAG: 4-phosphoerythronate dehydrogenase PdxB [Tannerellaceae bacterium]|jgi:erythronate-4-phosphate dehydrogenase|nr:4-phosphoerythronate dehydrogenase PdxB [Tannerellaceae bacterium]